MSDSKLLQCFDFIIIGAGIIGLSIAKVLSEHLPKSSILIIEKESRIGLHASGRNSGVLHSGIYYPEKSLKSQLTLTGCKLMSDFCYENKLPIIKAGKIILPRNKLENKTIVMLLNRAKSVGINAHLIDALQLQEIEPLASITMGRALYLPQVQVVNPKAILKKILERNKQSGVKVSLECKLLNINEEKSIIDTSKGKFSYGKLINCAGVYADKVAHQMNLASEYLLLPFKGVYKKLTSLM